MLDNVVNGKLDEVVADLDLGVNVNASDDNGDTALMLAAYNGHLDIVKLLCERRADVNAVSDNRDFALTDACIGKHEIVDYLLQRKANVNQKNNFGGTALSKATSFTYNNSVIQLLLDHKAEVERNVVESCVASGFSNPYVELMQKALKGGMLPP